MQSSGLDGAISTTEKDEFCFHEMRLFATVRTSESKEVLFIGGGDGGVVVRCLNTDVKKVTLST